MFSQELQRATANTFEDARIAKRAVSSFSRMGDSLLRALRLWYPQALPYQVGVCASRSSQPTDDVARSALATPCRAP